MAKGIILKGNDYNEMIIKGLKKLELKKKDVDIKIFKLKDEEHKYKVRIIKKDTQKNENKISYDQYFNIDFKDEGVYLKLNKAIENKEMFLKYFDKFISRLNIVDLDKSKLKTILNVDSINDGIIAPFQVAPIIDETVIVTTDVTKMRSYIEFLPAYKGNSIRKSEVIEKINNAIKFGLIEQRLDYLIESRTYFKKFEIAKGIEPIDGKDGTINYNIEFLHNTVPELLEDGTVDYKDVHTITTVVKNQVIGVLISEEKGKNGRTIDGDLILSKDGKKPDVKFGKNLELDNMKKIISTKDGFIQKNDNLISVIELLEINGDVDNSTGNIHFDGKIIIKGIIRTGFSVYARDGMDVFGVVESAHLKAEGDITLKNGMHGNDKGSIETTGSVIAKYLANCNVVASGEIKTAAIMHSKISSQSDINVIGKNATIVGGILKSKGNINAFTIGSEVETPTTLEVGVDPELKHRYEEIQIELKHEKNQLDNLNKSILILSKKAKDDTISDKNKQKLFLFIENQKKIKKHIEQLENEFNSTEEKFELLSKGKIRVDDSIYPGVKITIGNDVMFVRRKLNRCTIFKQNGEITVGPY